MSLESDHSSSPMRVPFLVQLIAWLTGLAACYAGMTNQIAEWNTEVATVQFLLLAGAPILWMIERRRIVPDKVDQSIESTSWRAWVAAAFVGLTSWSTCAFVGHKMEELPPAYHDEYSYLFQARTLLLGEFSVPSHSSHPELFNQMHVLNEGRMASRYYPGTGLWLAPFLAIHHPYWGYWLASSLASVFVFWTGHELGRLRVAMISGFACALSPGIALFGNLLLAHQPTLMGLCFFVWAFVKWQRTRCPRNAFYAGCGLSFAMLCRPATAAGFGLPFGIVMFTWLLMGRESAHVASLARRFRTAMAIGIPLAIGWSLMLAYHERVTGSWRTSPYQLYTDIYTPRHVYGFNNVERGKQKEGPKVLKAYDRWAENLTPELAIVIFRDRWFASWLWTFDILPLLVSSIVSVGTFFRSDRRWVAVGFAIISLHAIHIPYWYAGIMGWHYVFETAPLWCLLLGFATDRLLRDWRNSGRWLMPLWWSLLLMTSLAGNYFPFRSIVRTSSMTPRVLHGISSIYYPRRRYEEFDRWLNENIKNQPAVVLIEIDLDDTHVDYVVNSPSLNGPILRARFIRGETDVKEIAEAFPDRYLYLCRPVRKTIEQIQSKNL